MRMLAERKSRSQHNSSTKQDSFTTLPGSSQSGSKKRKQSTLPEEGKSPATEYGANYGHGAFSSLCSAKVAKQSPQYSEHAFCSGQSISMIPASLVTKGFLRTVSPIAADVIFQSLIQKDLQISDTRRKTTGFGFGVKTVQFVLATTSQQDDRNVFGTPQVLLLCCCVVCTDCADCRGGSHSALLINI